MKKKDKSTKKSPKLKNTPEVREAILYNEMHDDHGPVIIGRREEQPTF